MGNKRLVRQSGGHRSETSADAPGQDMGRMLIESENLPSQVA
jgi:hypothetical protein